MTPRDPKKKGSSLTRLVSDALKARKLTLPETEDEIAAAEAEIADQKEPLPPALQNPWGFLDANARLKLRAPESPPTDEEVERELARAARAGGTLTEEVLERMRRDRAAAEAKAKEDEAD
jgi:hypothetical protein